MNNHLSPQIIKHKKRPYDVGNPGTVWGQAQTCDRVEQINGIPTLCLRYLDLKQQHRYKQTIKKNTYRFTSTQKDSIISEK